MSSKFKFATIMSLCALIVGSLMPADAQQLPKPLVPVTEDFTLKNGLRVLLSEDHTAPVVSVYLVYNVGSRDEVKGRSGFAHLFEHMMFEGSENIGKTEHFKYVQGAGGYANASTHHEFTNYFERLPSNQVNLALWLEADRMKSLRVTDENFKNQLETVKEEKRGRIDNKPYSAAWLKVDELLFDNWANQHPVIGSFEDLEASSTADIQKFFHTYYAPNNAVIAVVGDIDAKDVHKQVEKYFGDIPRAPDPAKPVVAESDVAKPKYLKVEDKHAKIPGFWMAWKAPESRSPDSYPMMVLATLLAEGDSSRLYQRMIKGDQIALNADASYDQRRGPSAFNAFVLFKPTVTTAEKARDVVWSELDRVKNEPVPATEVEKAKNQLLRGLFSSNASQSLQKTMGRAQLLAEYALFYGDTKLIDQDVEDLMKVTPEDIQRVAKKYLTRDSLIVLDVVPETKKAESHEGHDHQ